MSFLQLLKYQLRNPQDLGYFIQKVVECMKLTATFLFPLFKFQG